MKDFWRMVTRIGRKKGNRARVPGRGRKRKGIEDLTKDQISVLLRGDLSIRQKSKALGMSVGWVSKWQGALNREVGAVFFRFPWRSKK